MVVTMPAISGCVSHRPPREALLASFRARMAVGDALYGLQHSSGSEAMIELAGAAGFDFIMIDTEHSTLGLPQVERSVRAAEASGVVALVRVERNDPTVIGRCLDAGACGIVVPHIENAAQAREAVAAMRYAPQGMRSKTSGSRAASWGMTDWTSYQDWANRELLFVPLVESPAGVEAIDEILAVPGVSFVLFGPGDLSQAYGFPGAGLDAEPVRQALARTVASAQARGIGVCTFPVPGMTPERVRSLHREGVDIIIWGVDLVIIGIHLRAFIETIRPTGSI